MNSLKELDLSRCSKVNDAGINHILSVPNLEKLHISKTSVTAKGVKLLASLKNLSLLDLGGLPVDDASLASLQVFHFLCRLTFVFVLFWVIPLPTNHFTSNNFWFKL
jgi:hypothetical protein